MCVCPRRAQFRAAAARGTSRDLHALAVTTDNTTPLPSPSARASQTRPQQMFCLIKCLFFFSFFFPSFPLYLLKGASSPLPSLSQRQGRAHQIRTPPPPRGARLALWANGRRRRGGRHAAREAGEPRGRWRVAGLRLCARSPRPAPPRSKKSPAPLQKVQKAGSAFLPFRAWSRVTAP